MKKILLTLLLTLTSNAQSLRIEINEFHKNQINYKLLDTRTFSIYSKGHIPHAINFPIDLTYEDMQENGKLTNPFSMQKIIQARGLNANDKLVIYDDGSFFNAARLFWALEVYGFKNVKLLNAGYQQWMQKKYKSSIQIPQLVKSNYITIIDNNRLATKFSTQVATHNPNQIILDARSNNAYIGLQSSANRSGHIPKALNIPASNNVDNTTNMSTLKSLKKLANIYKDIDKSKKIILYCAIGRVSATNYFALRELGYNVANYDASWREWGNDNNLPIINPSKNLPKIFFEQHKNERW